MCLVSYARMCSVAGGSCLLPLGAVENVFGSRWRLGIISVAGDGWECV
jgi:hypothetical protein